MFSWFVLYAVKMSILILYRRIFSTRRYRITSAVLMAVSSVWFIATMAGNLVICTPIDHFWHRTTPGRCLNFDLYFLVVGVVEIVLDLAILVIPVWGTLSLQMALRTRILVLGIFLVGCLYVALRSCQPVNKIQDVG